MSSNKQPIESIQLLAPAKLNLFLHITGRREDGYHQIQTVFQMLNYGDQMKFEMAPAGNISLHVEQHQDFHSAEAVPLHNNLVIQAADALAARLAEGSLSAKGSPGARITLQKRIPMGAGLGGGSSDAAITLVALNKLWSMNLGLDELCEIGGKLGADVPVFIRGKSAWGEGIGDQLQPLELGHCWYLVITPPCAVATSKIFSNEHLTRNSPAIKIAAFLAAGTRNDCESVTRKLYPEVDEALNWLGQITEARMTGTGSSIFARFAEKAEAEKVLSNLPTNLKGFVAEGIDSLEHRSWPA